jgi:hypothetical protein
VSPLAARVTRVRIALDERRQDGEASRTTCERFDEHDARRSVGGAVNESHSLGVQALVGEGREERPELLRPVHETHTGALAGDLPRGVNETP